MRLACEVALQGVANGDGGPFGAVVVRDGKVIASAHNMVVATSDSTAHAEIVAIRKAEQALGTYDLSGCEMYATSYPCPMCLGAIYWARLSRLYFAATRADAAEAGFDDLLIYQEVARPLAERRLPAVQLLRDQALAAFAEWKANPAKTAY